MKKTVSAMILILSAATILMAGEQTPSPGKTYSVSLISAKCLESSRSQFAPILLEAEFEVTSEESLDDIKTPLRTQAELTGFGSTKISRVVFPPSQLRNRRFQHILMFPSSGSTKDLDQRGGNKSKTIICNLTFQGKKIECEVFRKKPSLEVSGKDKEIAALVKQILNSAEKWRNPLAHVKRKNRKIGGDQVDAFASRFKARLDPLDIDALKLAKLLIQVPETFGKYGHGRNQEEARKNVGIEDLVQTSVQLQASSDKAFSGYGLFLGGFLEGLRSNWLEAEKYLKEFSKVGKLGGLRYITDEALEDIQRKKKTW